MLTVAGEIAAVGKGLTFTVLEAEAVHPLASVTVTEYDVVDEGETVIDTVDAPVLHEYEVPPLAVKFALTPLQMLTVAGEIAAVGKGLTITVLEVEAVHPFASVTVTE